MPRRMDRDARKSQLAEAVWQVILDKGVSAASVRNVAEQAGVVVGSLRHVFPTRAELIAFSAQLMVQRATERVLATTPREDVREYALDILRNLLPLTADSRAELEVNIALFGEHAAVPELTAIRDHAHEQLALACTRVVQMLSGSDDPDENTSAARRLHALIDGLAFHLLHQQPEDDASWAIAVLEEEIGRLGDATR